MSAPVEHLYVVVYDIADSRRLRRMHRLLSGYGEWVQLSVFCCRLTPVRHARLLAEIEETVARGDDHVLLMKLGPPNTRRSLFRSIGKPFQPPSRTPVIV